MELLSALFVENIGFRQAPGPATRIDLEGVMFSVAAEQPPPVTLSPNLLLLLRAERDESGQAAIESIVSDIEGNDVHSAKQLLQIAPGKFGYRVFNHELRFSDYGTIIVRCRVDEKPWLRVPLTLLPAAPPS